VSRKAGHFERSVAPAMPGEHASQGVYSEWTLSSLSLFLFLLATALGGPVLADPLVSAVTAGPKVSAVTVGPKAPVVVAGPKVPAGPKVSAAVLAPVEEALRAACGCERFTVRWSIPTAVAAGAAVLDSLAAIPDSASLRALTASEAGMSSAGPDRVPVRLRGWRNGRVVEYLAEAQPLCGGKTLTVARSVRPGTVLRADDIEPMDGWFAPSIWRDAVSAAEGKAARRALVPGRPLGRDDLAEPALVRRGSAVRVRCQLGGIVIEGLGVARKDGSRGERVGVRMAGASRDCLGVVTGPGEVRAGVARSPSAERPDARSSPSTPPRPTRRHRRPAHDPHRRSPGRHRDCVGTKVQSRRRHIVIDAVKYDALVQRT
jgi:flagella basal body P-ring formation protein FlgA